MAKKYACYMEEEEDPSVVGAGVFARRVADIRPPEDNGGASAARVFAVAVGQEKAEGHLDLWYAIRRPGREDGNPSRVNGSHTCKDPVTLGQEGDEYDPVLGVGAGEVMDLPFIGYPQTPTKASPEVLRAGDSGPANPTLSE